MEGLSYIQDISWKAVFHEWQKGEQWQRSWRDHWEERGFDSWSEWRGSYVAPLKPIERDWKLYKMTDHAIIGDFFGTPTRGWIDKCYEGKMSLKLKDIQGHEVISDNDKIAEIEGDFPVITMLTGVRVMGGVYLIEGMHRANALFRIVEKTGQNAHAEVYLAVAEIPENKIVALGKGDRK